MITLNLNIASYRFKFTVTQKRANRPDFLLKLLSEVAHVRIGNRFSRIVRLIVYRVKIRRFIGANLTALVFAVNVIAPSAQAFNVPVKPAQPEVVTIEAPDAPIATVVNRRYPVDKPVISQGYRFFHPGLDIDGVTGDPIYPIMNGRVVSAGQELFFGKAVRIEHEGGIGSLYAHLNKINVQAGDEVTTNSKIGEMGNTGHSFGDHLHLEVYNNSRNVNPYTVLPPK